MTKYDVIIVGGGTAGCVLASRLSEDPNRKVLLLEAGPDYATDEVTPREILDAKMPPMSHDWGYKDASSIKLGRDVFLPRGRVIGGSSSTNYAFAMRPRPADHDEWAEMGLEGWGWEDVLPLYKEMENDAHGDEKWHGRNGPFAVTRPTWDTIAKTARAFAEACRNKNIPVIDDVNDPRETGFGIVPRNVKDGVRQSLARSYLNPVRHRENLTVFGDSLVDRVLLQGTKVSGVLLSDGTEISADQVILAGGAFNSPAILMRSGIGPKDELEKHGIPLRHELPGVGRNLMEHPVFWNIYAANPDGEEPETIFQSCLSLAVSEDEPDYDLHLIPSSILPAEDIPPQYVPPLEDHPTGYSFVVFVSNMRPESRGSVTLKSTDPNDSPVIDLNLYGEARDIEVVTKGVQIARKLIKTEAFSDIAVQELAPGPNVSDDELPDAIRSAVTHYNHPSGTCKMGVASDNDAVVDGDGRVFGLEGLAVIDASIMPVLPRVAINPATVLIAEKLSKTFHSSSPSNLLQLTDR